jgi:circadian clock protein KaiC
MTTKALKRVATGIEGLDRILAGGLYETGLYIVQGAAGAGKTILANQICFHVAEQKGKAVYYTLLTEAHDRMIGFLQGLTFFKPAMVPSGVNYVSGYKVLEAEGLPGVVRSVRDVIARERPTFLVIDGLVSAEEVAPSDSVFKKFLHEVQTIGAMFRCTIVLLTNSNAAQRIQAEHTMVDGIIELCAEIVQLKPRRNLTVSKLRGTGQLRGQHSFEISNQGITVRPRIEVILQEQGQRPRATDGGRRAFGITALDEMLHGGLTANSNTMVMGPSGTGKTILGMHFLNEAAAAGETSLFFTFYERAEELVSKANRLGMKPLARAIENGKTRVVWQSSVEANIDRIGADLLTAFEEIRPARVFIDSMQGFQVTADHPERIQDFFAAVGDYFVGKGATLLFTAESHDLLGAPLRPPFANASRMCHNILVLRYSELSGRLARVIAILKMRDSGFKHDIRELQIGETGIEILGTASGVDSVLLGGGRRTSDNEGDGG